MDPIKDQTHHVPIPVVQLRINEIVQKPVDGFVVVEHLEEGDQPWQFGRLEHFTYSIILVN